MRKPYYLYKRSRSRYYSCQFRNPITGELEPETSTGETNKTRAEAWARERIGDQRGSSMLFGEYARKFFGPDCPRCNRYLSEGTPYSPTTIANYDYFLRRLILTDKVICSKPLGTIRRGDIIQLRERWIKYIGHTVSLEKPLETLRIIFAEALYMEYIEYNPVTKVKNIAYTKRKQNYLTIEQIKEIIKPENFALNYTPNKYRPVHRAGADNGFRFCVATALYAYAGIRASEIRALKWKDVDLPVRRIHIERAFKKKSSTILGPPKNGHARFTVIPDILVPFLSEPKTPETWVCGINEKHPMGYKKWHDMFKTICDNRETPSTLHGLRHTLNTALLEKYPQYKELIKAALGWTSDVQKNNEKRYGTDIQENYTHREQYDLSPLIVAIDDLFADKKEGAENGEKTGNN
jgi:integrase